MYHTSGAPTAVCHRPNYRQLVCWHADPAYPLPRVVSRHAGQPDECCLEQIQGRCCFKQTWGRVVARHLPHFCHAVLQVLDLSANLAEQLPVGVLELSGLRELHAGMNRLGVHTHSFRRLEELQVLVLASNKLVGVHSSLWGLTSLVRLDLGHNNLTELPQEVSQLTGLTVSEAHQCS